VSNTQATISGLSGSGGSEVQNFCYDEQNRLLWAGNSTRQRPYGCFSNFSAYGFVLNDVWWAWKEPALPALALSYDEGLRWD
jgi:hypothetical protein